MDDLNLDELEKDINNKNVVEERIRNLHTGKKEAELRAETEAKARQEAEGKLATMEKETSFLNSFSDINAKFPGATEFKDKIREKVVSGYSVEDATVAILHAEGKLGANPTPQAPIGNVAGGSAPNQINTPNIKPVSEMTRDERWGALREAEKRGDISM